MNWYYFCQQSMMKQIYDGVLVVQNDFFKFNLLLEINEEIISDYSPAIDSFFFLEYYFSF